MNVFPPADMDLYINYIVSGYTATDLAATKRPPRNATENREARTTVSIVLASLFVMFTRNTYDVCDVFGVEPRNGNVCVCMCVR